MFDICNWNLSRSRIVDRLRSELGSGMGDVTMGGITASRRTVVKGAAWSVPVIMAATAVPIAAASTVNDCEPQVLAWSIGWSSTMTDGAGGAIDASGLNGCGSPQPEADGKWWQWCDAPWDSDLVYTKTYHLAVTAGQSYFLTFSTHSGHGTNVQSDGSVQEGPSSPANLTLSIDGTQLWGGYTVSTEGVTGEGSSGANWNALTMNLDYTDTTTDQSWTASYTATTTGTVALTLQWTVSQTVLGTNCSDDIGISSLALTCAAPNGSGGNN